MVENKMIVRQLGMTPYMDTYKAMHDFTAQRTEQTIDEIWLTEHPPVFTQGKVGKEQHLLSNTETIPVIQTDRGGQITYHGPGQQIMYVLIDLKRRKIGIREIVTMLENCVIEAAAKRHIDAKAKADAPGVYVNNEKICSLGLHIQHGCTLHGLALNVDMDLSPFKQINPCGYSGLVMTQMSQHTSLVDRPAICHDLISAFAKPLNCELVYDPSLKQE